MRDLYESNANTISRRICELNSSLSEIDSVNADLILHRVGCFHVLDQSAFYWWESLRSAESIFYGGDVNKWRSVLSGQLSLIEGDSVILAVTDDEAYPWPLIMVNDKKAVLPVLEGLQFFEYFITSIDCRMVIFDTHSNELIWSKV